MTEYTEQNITVIHPWGEDEEGNTFEGDGHCNICFHGDGDVRCIRCGRSTGGPYVCQCARGPFEGPCVKN